MFFGLLANMFTILHIIALKSSIGCLLYSFCTTLPEIDHILHAFASGIDLWLFHLPHPPHLLWRNPVLAWKPWFSKPIWYKIVLQACYSITLYMFLNQTWLSVGKQRVLPQYGDCITRNCVLARTWVGLLRSLQETQVSVFWVFYVIIG